MQLKGLFHTMSEYIGPYISKYILVIFCERSQRKIALKFVLSGKHYLATLHNMSILLAYTVATSHTDVKHFTVVLVKLDSTIL